MHCKKGVIFALVFAVFLLSQFAFVSAAGETTERFTNLLDGIGGFIEPLSNGILGDASGTDELAMQVLSFLLVALIVFGILSTVNFFGPGKEWINVIIGLIVAIIGVRFMPDNFLEAATLPSSALVMFLVMVVPFVAAFYIIQKSVTSSNVRRALWAVYGVLVMVLWGYNVLNNPNAVANWMYPLIGAGILVAFVFDGTFHKWWNKGRAERMMAENAQDEVDKLVGEINHLQALMTGATTVQRQAYQRQIKKLKDNLNALQGISAPSSGWVKLFWVVIVVLFLFIVYLFWPAIKGIFGF